MQSPRDEPLFGLIELRSDGTVLYYQPEDQQGERLGFVGRNFFKDLASFPGSKEFELQVNNFLHGRAPAFNFDFIFHVGTVTVPARILLARTRESTGADGEESVFMHIKRI
ncbi:MAG TPA: hypothetical protein VGV59_01510 [Pyrinomonadaceae bacterium]|nr:hypothetical protein [Pyrinomonadaceae bacterium]